MAVRVIVHPTLQDLRKEGQKHYNNWQGRTTRDDDLMEAAGICHRFHMADSPVYAVVRLAPPNIGVGVVSHEMAHAAVHLWEIQHKWDPKVRLGCENDEWFCWVLGELVRCAVDKMWEIGLYTN